MPITLPTASFSSWLFHTPYHKKILWMGAAAIVLQFVVFKYFYPYASYIHGDSFVYLDIAYHNLDIETYMVGYARFLRFFSVFTSSDMALVAFQYLLLQCSALFFLTSLFYFYRPRRIMQFVLCCFMVLNPLFLYMANLISSDGFFLALSLIWFALLLWILHKPGTVVIVLHTLVFFIAFTVRYNALIYPAIAIVVYAFSSMRIIQKIVGLGAGLLLCGLFILYTGNKYEKLTGTWQYAPFSGWQMANNAMYAYRYVDSTERKPVPAKYRILDNMIRTYFDSTRDVKKYPVEALEASTVYMWTPGLTLYKYRDALFKKDTAATEFKKWASMGPFYKAYGIYIIKKYPLKYIRHFIWPNALKYYAPPVEFLSSYNTGNNYVPPIVQKWFQYKSNKVTTRTGDLNIRLLDYYPILSGTFNIVMLCCLLCFGLLHGFHSNTLFRKGVFLGGGIWLINAAFTILASSAALRFQAFPLLVTVTFAMLLIDWLWKAGVEESKSISAEDKDTEASLTIHAFAHTRH